MQNQNYKLANLLFDALYRTENQNTSAIPSQNFYPNFSCLIHSTFCVLADFYYKKCSPYSPDEQTLNETFVTEVLTRYQNYLNNPETSSIPSYFLLKSFTIATDNNLYFDHTFIFNNFQPAKPYLQINNFVITVLQKVLVYEPAVYNFSNETIKLTYSNTYDTRFNHFIYTLNKIKEFELSIKPQCNIYENCAVKANGFFNIYQMKDNKPTAKQGFENFGVINNFFERIIPNSPDLIPCIRMYINEAIKELKPDYDKISHLLHWLTMGDTNTFDRLALDFVHRIMQPGYQSRNTIVSGDIIKLYAWDSLNKLMLEHVNFCSRESFVFENLPYNEVIERLMNKRDIYDQSENIPVNINPFFHHYFFCNPNESFSELDKGNKHIHINFEFGEKNFNLYWLKRDDYIWLAEIFLMHGWHIINNSTKTRKSKERNITTEFIKTFLQKEGKYHNDNHSIRLPLALVYELYCAYFNIEKNNPRATPVTNIELRKIASEKLHIEYGNMKITKEDVEYVTEVIKPMMQKYKIQFEDNWITEENGKSKTSWALICTVKNDFWEYLGKSRLPYDLNSTEYEAFDRYVYNLYTEYKETLVYMPIPEETEKLVPFGQRFINPYKS